MPRKHEGRTAIGCSNLQVKGDPSRHGADLIIFPDVFYVHFLLKALGTPYASLARKIRNRDISTIKLDDCIAQAFVEETSVKHINNVLLLRRRR